MENFYPIKVHCPRCSKEATVLETAFSIKGEIRYILVCVVCGIKLESVLTWENTILYCAQKETIQAAITPEVKTLQ